MGFEWRGADHFQRHLRQLAADGAAERDALAGQKALEILWVPIKVKRPLVEGLRNFWANLGQKTAGVRRLFFSTNFHGPEETMKHLHDDLLYGRMPR